MKKFEIKDGHIGTARVRQVTPVGAGPAGAVGRAAGVQRAGAKGVRQKGGGRRRAKRSDATPQEILTEAAVALWGSAAVPEFENGVPGRRYRIDLAFPAARLAVEVDGWQFHGRMLGDFERDRERQNLFTLQGWRILRYPAGVIRSDLSMVIAQIALALDA